MSNDFKGDVKDFAMVVPVPTVLREQDIRIVDRRVFQMLDQYSSPRLVEYYDENPCQQWLYSDMMVMDEVAEGGSDDHAGTSRAGRQGLWGHHRGAMKWESTTCRS
ncbi:MAG: DUF2330 domain-containing protein [Flavobacteriales bacterium]